MIPRTAILTLILAVFLSMPVIGATGVTLENATPIEICLTCNKVTVLIKPGDKKLNLKEQPEIEAISLAGEPRDPTKFKAKWLGSPKPRSIELTLDLKSLVRAGTYDIYLNLQPKSDPGADRLKIQVTHPAPKLAAIPKLIIDRTYLFVGASSDTHPKLYLNEISKKSNLTNLRIQSVGNASVGNKPIGGTLNFTNVSKLVNAGDTTTPEYQLANDFDLGTASGSLRLDVDETLDPVATVDFEVHSHVHWIYIGVIIAIGLLCSYFIKVYLQQRIELDQAQADAQRLLDHIRDEEARHVDNIFHLAYAGQRNALEQAVQGDNPQVINDAKSTLDTAWRTAFQALSTRHQEQQSNYDKLRDVTNYDWLVPPTVSALITAARNAQAAVLPLLEIDNLEEVHNQLVRITLALGNGVRQAGLTWQSNARDILEVLAGKPNGISQAVSIKLEKPVADLGASLVRVATATAVGTPEQMQQVLNDLQVERLSVLQFVTWLKNTIDLEITKADDLVKNAHLTSWNMAVFSLLATAKEVFYAFLDSVVDKPDPAALTHQLSEMHESWVKALQGQFATQNTNVKNALDARDYVGAVSVAISEKRVGAAPLGAAPAVAPWSVPAFVPGVGIPTHGSVYAYHSYFQTLFAPTPVTRTTVTPPERLKRDKRLQSIIIGIVVIVAGYGLQLNTFVGTFSDLSTLFFWAFGLDLTIDALKNISHK